MNPLLTSLLMVVAIVPAQSQTVPSLPASWIAKAARGNMLVSAGDSFPNSDLTTTIGNGFVGGDVGCSGGSGGSAGALHIAGVYSGYSQSQHFSVTRATLPNPLAMTPINTIDGNDHVLKHKGPTIPPYVGAAMDLEQPAYFQRWMAPQQCGNSSQIETMYYAHRKFRNLLVLHISLVDADHSCTIQLKSCQAQASGVIPRGPGLFEVHSPEQPADPKFPRRTPSSAAIISDAIPTNLTLAPNGNGSTAVFLAVVMSTLEPNVTNATVVQLATSALKSYKYMNPETLFQLHSDAWADVYGLSPLTPTDSNPFGGGIEVDGNISLATKINSSWYYLLSSVRSDWPYGVSEGGLGSQAYNGHMFWSDGVMDGPLFAAINYKIADSLMAYRFNRLDAAKSIASMNGYAGAYWPWQSVVTGFEASCGNSSIVSSVTNRQPNQCYWMHEIHVSADTALFFRMNYRRSQNLTFLRETAWPVVSATADFFASRVNQSSDITKNWTILNVIGPDEHSYIQNSNTYTNYVAGQTMAFAVEISQLLNISDSNMVDWKIKSDNMYIPVQQFCDIYPWPNASVDGCPEENRLNIHPQYDGYHGQDINQADVVLMQWPFHAGFDSNIAKSDRLYYAKRTSGSDTKGFYTGDSSYAIANLFNNEREAAEKQFMLAFRHMLGPFHVWTELDPIVAKGTGHLNFLTGAGGFLENLVFGYGGLRYSDNGCLYVSPTLPPLGVTSLTLRGVAFVDGTIQLKVTSSQISLSRNGGSDLTVSTTGTLNSVPVKMKRAPQFTTVKPNQVLQICQVRSTTLHH